MRKIKLYFKRIPLAWRTFWYIVRTGEDIVNMYNYLRKIPQPRYIIEDRKDVETFGIDIVIPFEELARIRSDREGYVRYRIKQALMENAEELLDRAFQ